MVSAARRGPAAGGVARPIVRIAAGAAMVVLVAIAGCSVVGPKSISSGRMAYAEAITATGDEQVLQMIVRERYGQRLVPLSVNGVTANVRVQSSAGLQVGFGPERNFEGNLVPLSAGVAYEENPIVSYAPIDTPAFLRQLLSPIPLDLALLVLRSSNDRRLASLMLLERINGLKNVRRATTEEGIEPFLRVVGILTDFLSWDLAEFVSLGEGSFGLLLQIEEIRRTDRQDELFELMRLLELNDLLRETTWTGEMPSGRISGESDEQRTPAGDGEAPEDGDGKEPSLAGADAGAVERSEQDVLVISIRFSAVSDGSSIALRTRSVYDLVRIAAGAIDVPSDHVDRGLCAAAGEAGPTRGLVRIGRSERRPPDAATATPLHGWWYSIDLADRDSKEYFRLLSYLWSAQLASTGRDGLGPLLTVPVSR